jgi:hypothetical protein
MATANSPVNVDHHRCLFLKTVNGTNEHELCEVEDLSGCADEDSNKAEINRIDRDTDVAPQEPAALDEAQQAVMNAREQRLQQNQPQ